VEFPKHCDHRIYFVARPTAAKTDPSTNIILTQKRPALHGPFRNIWLST
jgi:hypothetical protein